LCFQVRPAQEAQKQASFDLWQSWIVVVSSFGLFLGCVFFVVSSFLSKKKENMMF
jgi:hypothetical protein